MSNANSAMDPEFVKFMAHATECDLVSFTPKCEPPDELKEFYFDRIGNENDDLTDIAWSTRTQFLCPDWHKLRKLRLSSTKAHSVKTRKRDFKSLARQHLSNKFKGNSDTEYGIAMEPQGRAKYAELQQEQIIEVGLVICRKIPWLCASPDGIIVTKNSSGTLRYKLLEIKSPSSRKGENLIDINDGYSSLPYLEIQNGSVHLKRSHPYFTQIQVSMLVTNVTECDLVIQSLVDFVVCTGKSDEIQG